MNSVSRALKRLCAKHRASAEAEVRENAKWPERKRNFAKCWGLGGGMRGGNFRRISKTLVSVLRILPPAK